MPSDKDLLDNHFDGEETAFPELIERYLKPLYSFTYRLVGDREAAEDIVQETCVKIWRKLSSYKKDQSFKTWVFTIARNTSVDYLRKKKGLPMSAFDLSDGSNVLLDTLESLEPLAPVILEREENIELVERALQEISPGARELLLLHFREGMTLAEMALVVKKPLNTVKSQHRRALISLKKALENLAPKGDSGTYK